MSSFPLLLTVYASFTHAFEADHLLAVSNIVSQRDNIRLSLKDGIFWGLGHASTILFTGILMILFKLSISVAYFHYLEAAVGSMLIALAVYRLLKFFREKKVVIHSHQHLHIHAVPARKQYHEHSLAYGIGLVHGLAGSGALVLVVMTQINGPVEGLIYLVIFGAGCIAGMVLAAGLFSVPFSKKIISLDKFRSCLIITSSLLCLLFGARVIYQNLLA